MIKYFYLVKFEYFVNDEYKSYFNLGIFSNLKLAKKKVSISSGLVGFRKYGFDNFKIIKFGAIFEFIPFIKILSIEILFNIILTIILYPIIQNAGNRLEDIFKNKKVLSRYY